MSENIFANEWIECLEAHYVHVIRTKDHVTEPSLTIVMHSAGFSDKQLAELRVRATMHVDDVGADFVPDLHILDGHHQHSASETHAHDHAAEQVSEPQIFNIPIDLPAAVEVEVISEVQSVSEAVSQLETETTVEAAEVTIEFLDGMEQVDAEGDMLEADLEPVDDGEAPVEPEAEEPDPDAPQQLSLF